MTKYFHHVFSNKEIAEYFREDYVSSKNLFHQYCQAMHRYAKGSRSWVLDSEAGLATDVVWIGEQEASRVLVLISGTHGVEGYCGSAVQSFILQSLQQQWLDVAPDCAILMIHALNPWGMQWARRCDQEGVDLNRNFIDFAKIPELDYRYSNVEACLELPIATERQKALSRLVAEWGEPALEEVLSGGQYHCAWAPFYGGSAPAFANRVIDEVIEHWRLQTRTLVVIDVHSGLGPWGYGEVISDHPLGSNGNVFATKLFLNSVALTAKGQSFSVPKRGLMDYRWHQLMQEQGCFVTLEFGTQGTANLFSVLTDEHLFWRENNRPNMHDQQYQLHRQAMLNHFNPQEILWRQTVLFRSWQLVQQVLSSW